MRGTGRGTKIVAVGRIWNKSEKSGNERNKKGNNFVAVGRIQKSANERNRKGNNFVAVGRVRQMLKKSEEIRR